MRWRGRCRLWPSAEYPRPFRLRCPTGPRPAWRAAGGFAVESHIDMVAHEMGLDPLEMQQRNAIADGDLTPLGETRRHLRCRETIEAGARALGWDQPKPP